jgi:hypothetical protein
MEDFSMKPLYLSDLMSTMDVPPSGGSAAKPKALAGLSAISAETDPGAFSASSTVTHYVGYLGYGYNVLDRRLYNSNDISSNSPILDASKLAQGGLIYRRRISSNEVRQIAGSSTREYQQDLGVTAGAKGSAGLFKASLDSSFNCGKKVSTSESFVKTLITIGLVKEYVDFSDISTDDLSKYVTPTFRRDIDNPQISPEKLFATYGTHVLLNMKLGGRMELSYKVKNTRRLSQQDLKASATAAYGAVSGSVSVSQSKEAKELTESSEFVASLYGGDVTVDIASLPKAQAAYSSWSKSLMGSNPVLEFVDTGDAEGLANPRCMLPIWSLASDPQRRREIEALYNQRLADVTYVADVYFGYGKNAGAAQVDLLAKIRDVSSDSPFVMIDHDLNSGASGMWIYMGYTTTKDPSQAATNALILIQGGKVPVPATKEGPDHARYLWSGQDLTKGCGGHTNIYFYYTKDRSAGNPLTELNLEVNSTLLFNGNDPGWSSVHSFTGDLKADLNYKAGGDYIYLWQRR